MRLLYIRDGEISCTSHPFGDPDNWNFHFHLSMDDQNNRESNCCSNTYQTHKKQPMQCIYLPAYGLIVHTCKIFFQNSGQNRQQKMQMVSVYVSCSVIYRDLLYKQVHKLIFTIADAFRFISTDALNYSTDSQKYCAVLLQYRRYLNVKVE